MEGEEGEVKKSQIFGYVVFEWPLMNCIWLVVAVPIGALSFVFELKTISKRFDDDLYLMWNQPSAGGVADLRVRSVIRASRYNMRFALLKYAILKLHLNRMLAQSLVVLVMKASPAKAGGPISSGSSIEGFAFLDRDTNL